MTDGAVAPVEASSAPTSVSAEGSTRPVRRCSGPVATGIGSCRSGSPAGSVGCGCCAGAAGDTTLARSYLEEAVLLTARAGTGPSLGFALLVAGALARDVVDPGVLAQAEQLAPRCR